MVTGVRIVDKIACGWTFFAVVILILDADRVLMRYSRR